MIENPNNWFYSSIKYAIETKSPMQYGCAFLIEENVPENVKQDYLKYINLIKKPFFSSGIGIFKPGYYNGSRGYQLVGFKNNLNDFEKEQAEIIKKLIKNGYISNEPFI